MRTYYRGPDAVVTGEVFVWRTTPPKVFAIRELRKVGIACREVRRYRQRGVQTAAGSAGLAMAVWPLVDTPALIVAVFLGVAISGMAVAAYRLRRPRMWELHATYRDVDVLLYASVDARVFNQVGRALRRAIEDSGTSGHLAA